MTMILIENDDRYSELKQKINKGLSDALFLHEDRILVVEGETDKTFYENFTDLNIKMSNALENEYPEKYSKKSCNDLILRAIKRRSIDFNMHWYGIIDKDYKTDDEVNEICAELKEYIFITDANSLETMIIKYVGVADFEKIIRRNIFYKCNFIKNNLTEDALRWSFFIGCLRELSYKKNLKLGINNTIKSHDFFRDYIESIGNDNTVFRFNSEAFFTELVSESKNIDEEILRYNIREYNEDEAWSICRGHDLFDFIDAITRKGTNKPRHETTVVPPWEHKLFDINKISRKFEETPLKKWFDKINNDV